MSFSFRRNGNPFGKDEFFAYNVIYCHNILFLVLWARIFFYKGKSMDYAKEIVVLRTSLEEIEKKFSVVRRLANVDYQSQINALSSSVNTCQNTLVSIEQDLQAINGALVSYGLDIATNTTNIETLASDVVTNTTNIASNADNISTNTANIANNTTNIATNTASISANSSAISGIQTALTAAQSSISTLQSQVSDLRFEMNIANGNITYLTSTLNEAVFNLQMLQSAVTTARGNITTLQGQMTTAQTDITANANAITALQSSLASVAFSGNYNDLTNKPSGTGDGGNNEEDEMAEMVVTSSSDEFYELNEFEFNNSKGERESTKIFFICSPEMFVEGNVDVFLYSFMQTYTSTIKMYYEEELVFEKAVTLSNYEQTFNIPFRVYPKQNKGYFKITINFDSFMFIKSATFHITSAKNFLFLNNNLRWTVTVCKNKYYIGHNRKYPNAYYVLSANNFNFSSPQYFGPGGSIWLTYLPKPTYSSGTLTIDENTLYGLGRNLWDFGFNVFDSNPSVIKYSKQQAYGFTFTYFTDDAANYNFFTVTSVYDNSGTLVYWSGHVESIFTKSFEKYKLNGVEVESGCWVANVAVQQVNMDNAPFNTFQGSVAVRNDGMCIFFPHYNATYCIELGVGRRPTAFRQENGDLHIYIGRNNYVIKFVLKKNASTNQYEVFSKQKIFGVQQYHETLDNKAICLIGEQIKLIDL